MTTSIKLYEENRDHTKKIHELELTIQEMTFKIQTLIKNHRDEVQSLKHKHAEENKIAVMNYQCVVQNNIKDEDEYKELKKIKNIQDKTLIIQNKQITALTDNFSIKKEQIDILKKCHKFFIKLYISTFIVLILDKILPNIIYSVTVEPILQFIVMYSSWILLSLSTLLPIIYYIFMYNTEFKILKSKIDYLNCYKNQSDLELKSSIMNKNITKEALNKININNKNITKETLNKININDKNIAKEEVLPNDGEFYNGNGDDDDDDCSVITTDSNNSN
jgi:hypothetical protein